MLLHCAKFGDLVGVKLFVEEKGIDPKSTDSVGYTALHKAAGGGHNEVVNYLISQGAEIDHKISSNNIAISGATPLSSSITGGHIQVAQHLIEKGADINVTVEGFDALDFAIESDKPDMIEFILTTYRRGIDIPNSRNITPLGVAMIKNKIKSLSFLLEKGADYRKLSEDDIPILVYPVLRFGRVGLDCMEVLLKYVKEKDGSEAVQEYVNLSAPNLMRTPLHMACLNQSYGGVKVLLKYGANPELKDRDGRLAYDLLGLIGDTHIFRQIRLLFESKNYKQCSR